MEKKLASPSQIRSLYAWYVVVVLMIAYISSFIDRQILSLLVEDIQRDMKINDFQISLLMGISFALFYTLLGLPIGRLADRYSRRNIIMVGVFVWSLMTAACGVVRTYFQFFLARVGVGVGEAALSPAAYPLIADYFPPHRLATALSVYSMGIYIGSGLAFLVGGRVAAWAAQIGDITVPGVGEIFSWQLVFFLVGLPGLLIVLLMLTVREPVRGGYLGGGPKPPLPLAEARAYFRKEWRMVVFHNFGFAFQTMATYASGYWTPTFLMRVLGWDIQKVGDVYGLVVIVFATSGIVAGGQMADFLRKRGKHYGRQTVMITGMLLTALFGLLLPVLANNTNVVFLLIPMVFFSSFGVGTATAVVQEVNPPQLRSLASAIFLFIVNILGMGVGPTLVAIFTEYVFQDKAMVGYSLALVGIICLSAGSWFIYLSRRAYRQALTQL